MVKLEVENLKALREALCVAQSAISQAYGQRQSAYIQSHNAQIQKVLDQIDILRPLGPEGKHGDRHTEFCGCDPNPLIDLKTTWRKLPGYPGYEVSGTGRLREIYYEGTDEQSEYVYMPKNDEAGREWYTLWLRDGGSHILSRKNLLQMTFPELKKEN